MGIIMNPMFLMQLKGEIEKFNTRHPKLQMFFADAMQRMDTGDVMEISLTKPDGSKMRTNIKVTAEDKQLLQNLTSSLTNQGK
jgi:hypothetical protein